MFMSQYKFFGGEKPDLYRLYRKLRGSSFQRSDIATEKVQLGIVATE